MEAFNDEVKRVIHVICVALGITRTHWMKEKKNKTLFARPIETSVSKNSKKEIKKKNISFNLIPV